MMKYVLIILVALTLIVVSLLGLRGFTFRQPPVQLFDDMVDQPKYKSQAESAFFPDGRTMRTPPAGSVAWGRDATVPDPKLLVDDQSCYQMKTLPRKIDADLLAEGQRLFNTYCMVCHGGAGTGNGITVSYGQAPPANYHTDRLRNVTDGYLYQVITEGKGLMGPYGPSLKPDDRWAVVAYVRALQRAGNATIKDVPQAQRQQLEQEGPR